MSNTIEKDWFTAAGLRAVVLLTSMGHRCGYVGVSKDHPLFGVGYGDNTEALAHPSPETEVGKRGVLSLLCASERMQSPEVVFDVHGSLTYAAEDDAYPVADSGLWWFGYDCGHSGDAPEPGSLMAKYRVSSDAVLRTLDYCVAECESLAQQIVEKTIWPQAARA